MMHVQSKDLILSKATSQTSTRSSTRHASSRSIGREGLDPVANTTVLMEQKSNFRQYGQMKSRDQRREEKKKEDQKEKVSEERRSRCAKR